MSTRRRSSRHPVPGLQLERACWADDLVVAGVDEVGRGAWAGPVSVGAAILPTDRRIYKLRDSKLLAAQERERIAARLAGAGAFTAVGHADNDEIDTLGMSRAMQLAARRAVDALPLRPHVLLLDGTWDFMADYGTDNRTLVRGDARCASIAAASIVAKVARDALMRAADPLHPAYDFVANKGYPAPRHVQALDEHGPCVLHRHSWAPIAARNQLTLLDAADGRLSAPV